MLHASVLLALATVVLATPAPHGHDDITVSSRTHLDRERHFLHNHYVPHTVTTITREHHHLKRRWNNGHGAHIDRSTHLDRVPHGNHDDQVAHTVNRVHVTRRSVEPTVALERRWNNDYDRDYDYERRGHGVHFDRSTHLDRVPHGNHDDQVAHTINRAHFTRRSVEPTVALERRWNNGHGVHFDRSTHLDRVPHGNHDDQVAHTVSRAHFTRRSVALERRGYESDSGSDSDSDYGRRRGGHNRGGYNRGHNNRGHNRGYLVRRNVLMGNGQFANGGFGVGNFNGGVGNFNGGINYRGNNGQFRNGGTYDDNFAHQHYSSHNSEAGEEDEAAKADAGASVVPVVKKKVLRKTAPSAEKATVQLERRGRHDRHHEHHHHH